LRRVNFASVFLIGGTRIAHLGKVVNTFHGEVDQVAIWDRPLASGEILVHCNMKSALVTNDIGVSRRLQGYWHFADAITFGSTVPDRTGNSVAATIMGGRFIAADGPTQVFRVVGGAADTLVRSYAHLATGPESWSHIAASHQTRHALEFSGLAPLSAGNAPELNITGDLTIEVKLMAAPGANRQNLGLVSKGLTHDGVDNRLCYSLMLTEERKLLFCFEDDRGGFHSFESLGIDEDLFKATVRLAVVSKAMHDGNKPRTEIQFFVNGEGMPVLTHTGPPAGLTSRHLDIGAGYRDVFQRHLMRATISDLRIWNTARSEKEILGRTPGSGSGLVGHWTFNEGVGPLVFDSARTNHIQLPSIDFYRWVPDPEGDEVVLYCDGVPLASEPEGFVDRSRGRPQFMLGADETLNGILSTFNGDIDEVRIWKTVRSPEEIHDNQYARLNGTEKDLGAWYPLDGYSLNRAVDLSGNGNDLEMRPHQAQAMQSVILPGNHLGLDPPFTSGYQSYAVANGANPLEFKASFWVKMPTEPTSEFAGLLCSSDGHSAGIDEAKLNWRFVTPDAGAFGVRFEVKDKILFAQVQISINDKSWHHIAGSYDSERKQIILYLDGVAQPPTHCDRNYNTNPNESILYFGRREYQFGQDRHAPSRPFNGEMAEVRLWDRPLEAEEIRNDMRTMPSGSERGLLGCWSFEDREPNGAIRDRANRVGPAEIADTRWKNPAFKATTIRQRPLVHQHVLSTAPVGLEIPQVRSALAGVETRYHCVTESSPAVREYGDLQTGSDGQMRGVLKRCYGFIRDGKWTLVSGFKVGDLESDWISQIQYAPQLEGYIEGAPPVPSENLTIRLPHLGQTYELASTIEVADADNTQRSFAIARERGVDTSASLKAGIGVGFGGFGKLTAGFEGSLETSAGWIEDITLESTEATSRVTSQGVQGFWEPEPPEFPPLLKRYVPTNVGVAIVPSETADLFALRLKHRDPKQASTFALHVRPNPDIPPEANAIMFPLNPRYVTQGVLDGHVGLKPANVDFGNKPPFTELSYFKPSDAYQRKSRIESDRQRLKSEYEGFATQSAAYGSLIGAVSGASAGVGGGIIGAVASILMGPAGMAVGAVIGATLSGPMTAIGSMIGGGIGTAISEGGLAELERTRPWERDLVNTYIWTADGGLFAETQQVMSAREDVIGGAFSLQGMFGSFTDFDLATIFSADVNSSAMIGGHYSYVTSKTERSETSFELAVELDVERDISTQPDHNVDPPNLDLEVGQPHPGKVDAYRFMSFYLRPDQDNRTEFLNQVVDPAWLRESTGGAAALIRELAADTGAPPCWRVLHRVTFVSRILEPFKDGAGTAEATLEQMMRSLGLESHMQLVYALDPLVQGNAIEPHQFTRAVADAVNRALPELSTKLPEITQLMRSYYGIAPA